MKWLMNISEQWRGILALGSAFMVGALAVIALLGFIALPDRVTVVETWQASHDSLVTAPQTDAIRRLQLRVEPIPEIQRMVYDVWCRDFPEKCQARPRPGGQP